LRLPDNGQGRDFHRAGCSRIRRNPGHGPQLEIRDFDRDIPRNQQVADFAAQVEKICCQEVDVFIAEVSKEKKEKQEKQKQEKKSQRKKNTNWILH
jgi:hypothetical protein